MGRSTRSGSARGGFTLIELLLVLFIVALLASIVTPTVTSGIKRSREATLREDLRAMRKALDDFYADHGAYPAQLQDLVEKRYLRSVPIDPMTEKSDTWGVEIAQAEMSDAEGAGAAGIRDVHSGSDATARDGTAYSEW